MSASTPYRNSSWPRSFLGALGLAAWTQSLVVACAAVSEPGTGAESPVPSVVPAAALGAAARALSDAVGFDPNAGADSGGFVALTYNVAGLPQILSRSRPSEHTPLIGEKLNRYDLVLLQESWQTPRPNPVAPLRCYHEMLVATARHRYKTPPEPQPLGNDRRRPTALLSDGLNVFSRLPLGNTRRVLWDRCVDTFNDCRALKGFSMTPMQLAPGAAVHVYNLHMEAGWTEADDAARDAAIDQLLAHVERHSDGQAVIIGGDFNLRGDRERTTVQLDRIRRGAGLRDACIACARPRNVDKLLYRGSKELRLEAVAWNLETDVFRSPGGEALSDHAPLAVRFEWSKREAIELDERSVDPIRPDPG